MNDDTKQFLEFNVIIAILVGYLYNEPLEISKVSQFIFFSLSSKLLYTFYFSDIIGDIWGGVPPKISENINQRKVSRVTNRAKNNPRGL